MRKLLLSIAAACLLAPAVRADDGIPAETLTTLKAATVQVKSKVGNSTGGASGFLLWAEGENGLVVTSYGIVAPGLKEGAREAQITVVFNAGAKGERTVTATVVAADPARDLAFLKVEKVSDLPAPIDIRQKPEVRETKTLYALGFHDPKTDPTLSVSKVTVSGVRQGEHEELAAVLFDGLINPSNGGSLVVDEKGRFVGVAVARLRGARGSAALGGAQLDRMLRGEVGAVDVATSAAPDGKVAVKFSAGVIDPLRKFSKVEVLYVRADQLKEKPAPNDKGVWGALPQAEKAALTVEPVKATATVELKAETRRKAEYLVQTAYVNAEGKTVYAPPQTCVVDFTLAKPVVSRDPQSTPGWGGPEVTALGEATVTEANLQTKGVPPCLCWARDGKSFFLLDADNGLVRRIDLASLNADQTFDVGWKCSWLAPSKEGPVVTVSDAQEVWLLDETTLKVKHKFEQGGVTWAASSPASSIAVGADHKGDRLKVFDLATGKVAREYETKDFVSRGPCSMTHLVMTPNGKYLFSLGGSEQVHRLKVTGQELDLEESSQRIVMDVTRGIAACDAYVCVPPSSGGSRPLKDHPKIVGGGTYVYGAEGFVKPAFTLAHGTWGQAVGFDPAARLVYAHDREHNLIVFSEGGRKLKELKLGPGKPVQFLAHPDGRRVVVLTDERLYLVTLAKE